MARCCSIIISRGDAGSRAEIPAYQPSDFGTGAWDIPCGISPVDRSDMASDQTAGFGAPRNGTGGISIFN
ncbi:hypothetical protein D3C74_254430 [compost metagenome]